MEFHLLILISNLINVRLVLFSDSYQWVIATIDLTKLVASPAPVVLKNTTAVSNTTITSGVSQTSAQVATLLFVLVAMCF